MLMDGFHFGFPPNHNRFTVGRDVKRFTFVSNNWLLIGAGALS